MTISQDTIQGTRDGATGVVNRSNKLPQNVRAAYNAAYNRYRSRYLIAQKNPKNSSR